ncbi:DUF2127 domain-containing protein [Leptolyngbya sp. FACHB-261]|uniref:DUF2127 domain-containing protein n=1 Tax=Leptolyngbya sp. FACHB-261 TaxID=2692806 RepID=UPI0016872C32|nr:DUF2127 domain-containing protein [Leptolyngbya sp. FACHB-261]MBD2104210.1 DUF2127 domain-containing protein [Leptolyngbya sp. FACHB-261]
MAELNRFDRPLHSEQGHNPTPQLVRPTGLLVLIAYKLGQAILLTFASIALLLARIHHSTIRQMALLLEDYPLESQQVVVNWVLVHVAQLSPHTLLFASVAAGLYALLSLVEAIGLWQERTWVRWLLLVAVGLSLPVEVYELWAEATWPKVGLLTINALIFWYVLKRFPDAHSTVSGEI